MEVEVARRKEAALAVVRARLPKRKLKEVRWLVDCGEKNGRVGLALSTGTHTHTEEEGTGLCSQRPSGLKRQEPVV